MENIRSLPGPYKLVQRLKDRELEKEALEKQMEKLKARLQVVENHNATQRDEVLQLTTTLEKQVMQMESFQRQVENLKCKLVQEKSNGQKEENRLLQDKIQELTDLLERQRAITAQEQNMRLQLTNKLEETKEALARQKSVKEMFINKERETRKELESLKRFCNPDTMNIMRITTEDGNDIKTKQKTVLPKDFEELKVAYAVSQEKFSKELQQEKDNYKALQQQLELLTDSSQIKLRYESELKAEMEKNSSLRKQLEKEIQSHAQRLYALVQQMNEEVQTLKRKASDKAMSLTKELEDLKEKLNQQTSTNQELVTKIQAEEEELTKLRGELKDETKEEKETLLLEEIKDCEEKLEMEAKKNSAWTKFKRSMGWSKEDEE